VYRLLSSIEAVLRWLLAYPLLTAQIALMMLVSWAGLGEELGAERLFWHEGRWEQFGTGIGVGILYGVVLFTIYVCYRPTRLVRWLRKPVRRYWRARAIRALTFAEKRALILRHRARAWTLFPSREAREVRLLGRFLLVALLLLLAVTLAGKGIAVRSAQSALQEQRDDERTRTENFKKLIESERQGADERLRAEYDALLEWMYPYEPSETYSKDRRYFWPHVLGYLSALLFSWLLFVLDERCFAPSLRVRLLRARPWRAFGNRTLEERLTALHVPRAQHPLHGIAFYLVCFTLLVVLLLWGAVRGLDARDRGEALTSPVTFVCLALVLFSLVYGLLAFHLRLQRLVIGGGALLLLMWNSTCCFPANHYKLEFPGLTGPPNSGAESSHVQLWKKAEPGSEGFDIERALDATRAYAKEHLIGADAPLQEMCKRWQQRPGCEGEKPRILIVCTSGGGIRAAVWTGVVLHKLDTLRGSATNGGPAAELRDHVRLFTGASGGMVGATLYVADFENGKFTDKHIEALAGDSLTRTAQSLVLNDMYLNTWLAPWQRAPQDRGRTLEFMWGRHAKDHLEGRNPWDKTFAQLRAAERVGKRPSMIYSPLMVEDARRLLLSNLDLSGDQPKDNLALAVGSQGIEARSAVEFHRLFPDLPPGQIAGRLWSSHTFAVSTAARMNATFPIISPAVSLPTDPPRRLVDAGIYDNYGVNLAAAWVLKNEPALRKYTSGVALVQVRAFPLHDARTKFANYDPNTGLLDAEPPRGDLLTDTLAAASAPAEALFAARANAAFYRNAEQLDVLHHVLNGAPASTGFPVRGSDTEKQLQNQFFTTVWLELRRPAALNWYLSAGEKENIVSGTKDNDVNLQLERLKLWFGTGGRRTDK
jgi:hypothetical protein